MSVLLPYVTMHYEKSGLAKTLAHQLILFIGYVALLSPSNQETFRWFVRLIPLNSACL